jgi:hypothetical protein
VPLQRGVTRRSIELIRTVLVNHRTCLSSVLTCFANLNISTETHVSIIGLSEVINVTAVSRKVEVHKSLCGTVIGTLNRLVVLPNEEYQPLDKGSRGGGQN